MGLVYSMKLETDVRFNLAFSFGGFLTHIPRRLGRNEALDSASDALVSTHSCFCSGLNMSIDALTKYSRALGVLRKYLDDSVKACSSETLAAIMLLLICQVGVYATIPMLNCYSLNIIQGFMGTNGRRFSGHAEGAAQILKARGPIAPRDDFEVEVLMTLRASVVSQVHII
jgi:hypothetical protein